MSLLHRIEELEKKMIPSQSAQLLDLACAALDGDETARLQFIEMSSGYAGTSRLREVFYPLLDGPIDPAAALLDETETSEGETV